MARRRFQFAILVGCLVLAVILWGFVTLTRMYEDDVLIPLRVQAPPNQALLSTVPREITVHVRGTGLQILNLKYLNRTSSCVVDLSKLASTSQGVFTVDREHFIRGISTPEPVRMLSVFPAAVTMATGDLFVKSVPVRLQTNIATRDGFRVIGLPVPNPSTVEVRGTKSVIESITTWPTEKISLADLHGQVAEIVDMSDSLTTLLNVVPPRILVNVNVQQEADICVTDVPITFEESGKVVLLPKRVSVTLRGGAEDLANITAADLRVSVPADSRGHVKLDVEAPTNVQVVGTSPSWVRVISMASP